MLFDLFIQWFRQFDCEILLNTEIRSFDRLRMVNLIYRDLVQVHLSIVEICHQSSLLNNFVKFDPRVCKVVDISNHVLIFGKQKHGAMAEQNYKSNQLGLEFHVAWGTA